MKLKDIITITVLSAIALALGMVLSMVSGTFGMISMVVSSGIPAFAIAPIFIIMANKVKKRGASFLFWLIYSLIYGLLGFWIMIPVCLIAGLASELVIGDYTNTKQISIAFIISMFIEAMHINIFVKVLGVEGIMKYTSLFTKEQATELVVFFSDKMILISVVTNIVLVLISAIFGQYIYNKFFGKVKTKGIL